MSGMGKLVVLGHATLVESKTLISSNDFGDFSKLHIYFFCFENHYVNCE